MPRPIVIDKPSHAELTKLIQMLEEIDDPSSRRRANVILLFGAGLAGQDIARELKAHPNTVYADLRAYAESGLKCLNRISSVGAPTQIKAEQVEEILRIANMEPFELGLPYGRWSLSNLREYLIKIKVVKAISREYLRRILKKGAIIYAGSNRRRSVRIRNECRFWQE